MICPICTGSLDEMDNLLICQDVCGAVFSLEYHGMCNHGDSEITMEGFENKEFLDKWGENIRRWRYGETQIAEEVKEDAR